MSVEADRERHRPQSITGIIILGLSVHRCFEIGPRITDFFLSLTC
jgi:hypothetical protein